MIPAPIPNQVCANGPFAQTYCPSGPLAHKGGGGAGAGAGRVISD